MRATRPAATHTNVTFLQSQMLRLIKGNDGHPKRCYCVDPNEALLKVPDFDGEDKFSKTLKAPC